MTTEPAILKRQLEATLPSRNGTLVVRVTPRDSAHRKCAAWNADHFEVQAYYTTTGPDALDLLERALQELPGVYLTTQVRGPGRNQVTNPEWPAALGASRRGFFDLRPQVVALISRAGVGASPATAEPRFTTEHIRDLVLSLDGDREHLNGVTHVSVTDMGGDMWIALEDAAAGVEQRFRLIIEEVR